MEREMLLKENGVVTKLVRNQYISSTSYMEKDENIFKTIINQKNLEDTPINIIEKIRKDVSRSITQIKNDNPSSISDIYMMIKNVKNKESLIKVLDLLITRYRVVNSKDIKNYISDYFDIFASIFIKKLMIAYYTNLIASLSKDKIEELYTLKIKNVSSKELLRIIDEPLSVSKNKSLNKMAEKVLLYSIDTVYDSTRKHLCWENCKNCSPIECQKIADQFKQRIDNYDFITDGYQILDSTGNVDTFVVTDCKNYKYQKNRVLTIEEKKRAQKIKIGLETSFFDATTLTEARKTEELWLKNKQLFKSRGNSYKNNNK